MMASRRRGMILVLVLVSLALAAALVTPLALFSGVEALESAHSSNTLRHELAAQSVVAILPGLLAEDRQLQRDLNRSNRAHLSFMLEEMQVQILIQDDTAKLPLPVLLTTADVGWAEPILSQLGVELGLPVQRPASTTPAASDPGPSSSHWTGCLDDLFAEPTDRDLFGTPRGARTWSQYLSPFGKAVHVWRADEAVLEAVLADLQPGLGRDIAEQRDDHPHGGIAELLAALELPNEIRQEAERRLTTQTERYSLLVRTTLGRDARQRYLICTATDPARVLVNWEVAP